MAFDPKAIKWDAPAAGGIDPNTIKWDTDAIKWDEDAPDVNALDVGGHMVEQASQGFGEVAANIGRLKNSTVGKIGSYVAPMVFGLPDFGGVNAKAQGMVGDYLSEKTGGMREFVGQTAGALTSAIGFGDETAEDVYQRMHAPTADLQRSMKENTITGDVFAPSSVSLGTNPTAVGMATNIGGTLARMAPVIAAARVNPLLGAAAGAGQAYEGSRSEESDRIDNMEREQIVAMPRFRELIAEETGLPFEEGYAAIGAATSRMFGDGPSSDGDKAVADAGARALQRLKDEAGHSAGLWSAPLGVLQGFIFTGKIGGAVASAARGSSTGLLGGARAAAGTAAGMTAAGAGEAVTEVGQKVAQAYGSTLATGEEGRNLTEDTAADAILGFGLGGLTNVSAPKRQQSVTERVFGGAGVNAGDVLGDVGEDTGPIKTEGVPMTAGAGVTLDEDGNVLEERSGLALPPPGPPPPGTDIGPAGPLQAETPPDWIVDSEETASAPGDWQAREQAKRQRAGGPGMGPVVDGVPTMAPDEMAQAAFDTAMETATSAMGRAPSKSSVNALAAKVAERFGVDPAALVKRSRNLVRVPAPIASVAPAPVAVTQPAAAQPVVAPELPRGRMFRRGRDAEAVELPGGAWLTRRRVAGHWQPWQRRRSFDPSGAHGYVPYQPQSGSVRTPVGTIRVGEDRREAAQTGPKAPNDIIDTIIAAGGISREAARMAGIDPSMLTTRRGATRWLFPRNNGMSLNGLRELLTTEGFFHQDDPDALPTVSDDDAFEIFNRALQGERIVSPNRAAEEAAYQASLLESNEEAAPPVVEPVVDDPRTDEDEQIAAEFLSRIEADPIARRVFDDFDADEDMDALGIVELTEVAERLGATPSEIRQAYNAQGDADLARNLWELIHNKEIANGPVARERQAGDRDGAPTQPGGAEAARDAARRTRPAGDEGAGAARSGEPVGQAALEQAAELERLRARVAELESVRGANEVTGLPGKAAFEADESLGWSTVAAIDMDGLGRLNDATSHEAANAVMIAMADAMRAAQVDGVRFYHLHGDELAARFQNPDDAASITLALQDALAAMSVRINVTLENGTVRAYSYDGIGITFGLGANYGTADAAAIRSKHEREAAGLRQNKNQPGPPRQLRDLAGIPQRRNDDDPGRQRAGGDVQGEPAALTLTDDTVVTPPVAERPASQASLFAPVTDIDRERLRFERDRPRPPVTDTVDIEEAINQTPPSGGVSVSGGDTNPAASAATTEEYRNGSVEEAVEPQDVFREEGPQSAEDVERRKEAEEAGARREAAAELGQAAAGHDEAGILATGRDDESADGEADQPSAVGDAGVGLRGQAGASRGATGRSRSPAGPVTENAIATEGDLVTLQHGDATVRVRRADWEGDRPKLRTYTKQGKPSQGFADRANLAEVASSKIEDFGEKIGGARKDVWSSFKDQLREVSDDNVLTEPLSKTWPQPDYQKMLDEGADSWVVAFVRSARDEIPRKPSKSWKQLAWAEKVKMLRDLANELLNNPKTVDLAKRKIKELNTRGMREMMSRIELYQLVGHAQSLAGVSFAEHHYSLYKGRENVRMWVVEKATAATAFSNWPRELATGDTKEQMLQAFKEKVASLQLSPEKAKVAAFDIYSYRGVVGYLIGKKVGRNHIDLAGPFPTVGEARAYRDANNSTLVAKLEASKEIPNERRDTNEPRVGEDMRNGQDVTPQMFGDAFGFKGVEFGNWVEQTKRQNDLNEAFDALMDMAAILGIPPKAISLNGELGIAFGARGSGGVKPAAAHYEPGKVVINLTKKNGAGSLGHEWWHALDNYFQRSRGKSEYATEALDVSLASRGSRFVEDAKMRKAMVESFGAVVSAIKNTALKARSAKLDAKRTKEYWTTGREMAARAFESYLITKLQDQNASNDYLANIVDEDTWSAMEKLGFELDGSYPYPTAGEVPIISAAFGKFFDTIESREGADGKVELFSNPAPGWESAAGDQLSQAAVDREVSKAQAEFDGVTIEVMDSIQGAPTSDRTKRLYPGANGLTDGKSRVWIFRHGLQSLQALRMTLAHEIIGHIGVERVIGADWPAVVDAIKRIRAGSTLASPAVVNAVKDAESRYPKADDLTFAREAVAIMAENGVTGSLMDRIVAAVRKYLRKVFGSLQWSDAEIRNLLRRAGEAARKPAVFRGAEFEAAQVVFHGTPHKVDRFRMDKIGTGEGAQAYGHGMYFASEKAVAEHYKRSIRNNFDGLVDIAKNAGMDHEGASALAEAYQKNMRFEDFERIILSGGFTPTIEAFRARVRPQLNAAHSAYSEFKREGNLYKVEVPEDSDLLDWDEPLSEQPKKVREALRKAYMDAGMPTDENGDPAHFARDPDGQSMYVALSGIGGPQRGSGRLLAAGVPGLRYLDGNSRGNGEGSHNYVIWSEEAIGDPSDGMASNPAPIAPFYSALARSIDDAKGAPKRAPAEAWAQWLDGAQRRGEFKQSERDWIGVDAWLRGRDSTTREELAEFVRANQVEVQETVLGEGGSDMQAVLDEYAEDIFDQPFDDLSADEQARVESEAAEDSRLKYSDPTKFSGYQLPGGQNYRELLLTLPVKTTLPNGFSLKQIEAGPRKGQWAVLGPGPLSENRYGLGATQAEAIANFGAHGHNGPTYKSSHFDQPNILAHVRFNERVDSEGKRVLFVEEVQSDWHQAGRKKGYKPKLNAQNFGEWTAAKGIDRAEMYRLWDNQTALTGADAETWREWRAHADAFAADIPDAPLKKEWPLTAMKRMIRYAADNGFDRIAWTTGDQQAERYDLSKHIDMIEYRAYGDGTYQMSAMRRGSEVLDERNVTIERIAEVVGKEIAEKIERGEGARGVDGAGRKIGQLSGLQLKVGGEGMRAFYDKMLPNELGKYVKKWGGKVGSTKIAETGGAIVVHNVPVHSIDITPAMREAAMQGQPLFSNPAQGPIERKMAEDARSGQPIDKLFRLPFQLLGGLDSHGRLKVGSKLHDWLSRVLTEKTPTEDGPFGWMAPILNTVRSGLIDRYGVPQDFVQRDERRSAEVRSVLMHAARVATDLEGLTTAEAKVLQAMLTGQEMPAGELGKLSQPIKEAIDQMGREAVEMGLISPEAYERNRGAYLHRSYLKYEADRTALGKAIGNFLDKRRKRLMGDTLRGRGMTMERNAEAIAAALDGSLAEGDIVTVLRQKTEKGVRTKYLRGPLNGPAPVGWENLGDWRVMKSIGKKAVLWRDFTPEERAKMGEILDARYNITKTFALMAHDLATGRFLRDIAANKDWARTDLPEGASAAEAGGRYDTYADSDWVRVPDAAIHGTNDGNGKPVKRWGALAGMYVRAPIWRDLNQLREMQNPQLWGSAWQKVLTFWKTNKTARNPVVHVNNVMSNMMFMDLADIRLRDLYRGIGAWKRGEADEDYRNAMAHGAFAGGFADQELKRKVLQPILDDILAKQKVDGQDTAESRLGVLHLLSTIWDGIKKVDGKMLDAYNAEDEIFRLAFYLRRQSLGDTPEEAARAARRQFIDYDIRAPWVNMARNTVLPFIGYTYRAIPILAQAIAERPWKLAKYATMAAAANWLGYLFAPGDEDDERKVMAPAVQGNTWTGTPRMIRMPWYDADGNPVFLDVRRWIPAGDVFDMNQSEIGLPAWMQFGGPLQLAGELMLNKQAFTKQPIVDPLTDTTGEKAGKVASWAWKAMAPNAPWIPESYSWDKIGQAITGETDELGRDYSVVEATASVLGVKAAGMDVALQRRYRDREFDRVDRELDFDLSSLKRERGRNKISDERFKAAVAKIVEKKRRLAVERRRVLSRSASKPNG